jgi:hypothetical protein
MNTFESDEECEEYRTKIINMVEGYKKVMELKQNNQYIKELKAKDIEKDEEIARLTTLLTEPKMSSILLNENNPFWVEYSDSSDSDSDSEDEY